MPRSSAGVILLAFRQGRRRRLPCQRPRHCPKTPKDRSGAAGAGLQGHRAKAGCRQPRPRTRQTWLCGCRAALFPLVYRCYLPVLQKGFLHLAACVNDEIQQTTIHESASLRFGNRWFRSGQRKQIIRTHPRLEIGPDYIGLVQLKGLEPL